MLKPIGNRIIIEQINVEQKTKSGIVLTDSAKEKTNQGRVVAVGSGLLLDNGNRAPLEVQVGDQIVYSPFGGTEIKVDSDEFIVLTENDILAVIE